LRCGGRHRLWRRRRSSFAIGADQSEKSTYGNFLSQWANDLLDDSGIKNFDLDRGLFRIDNGDDVSPLDRVAGLDQPLEDGAGLHVGTQGRHAKFSHGHPS
jgi:hypothetical protein